MAADDMGILHKNIYFKLLDKLNEIIIITNRNHDNNRKEANVKTY